MRRWVKTPGNILESPCVKAYTIVEKIILKYIEGNHERTHT